MAARTIEFQSTEPTDFKNGNAMFSDALSNMTSAFKQGQDTVKNFGQAVRDRNNALLNSVISGINQEDWSKPETQVVINNLIKDMSDNTSNMVDLDTAYKTIDSRATTLINRDNAMMENEKNRERYNNFVQDELADSLAKGYFSINTPEQLNEFNALVASQTGDVQYAIGKQISELSTANLKRKTSQLNEQTNYGKAVVGVNSGTLNSAFEAIYQGSKSNASDEIKQAGKTASDNVASLVSQNPSAYNQVMQSYYDYTKKAQEGEYTKQMQQGEHNRKVLKTQSDIQNDKERTAILRQAKEIEAYKAINGAKSGSNSTAQDVKKGMDNSLSEVNLTGVTNITADGNVSVDTPKMINSMMTNLVNIEKQFINEGSTKTNYADWKIGEGKDVVDKLYEDSFWGSKLFGGNNSRLDGLENAFPAGTSEAEKIKLVTALSSDTAKYARYFSSNDSPQEAIEGVLSQIRLSEQSQIKAKQKAYFNDVITKVAQTTGQPRLAVYNQLALAGRDKTAHVPDWVFTLDPSMHNEFMQQSIANMSDKQRKEFYKKHPKYDPNYKLPQPNKPKQPPTSNQRSVMNLGADGNSSVL